MRSYENAYSKLFKEESKLRRTSGMTKEQRAEEYSKTRHRLRALQTLSKWSPIADFEDTDELIQIKLENTETGELFFEDFEGLTYEQVRDIGTTMANSLAKEHETQFRWSLIGNTFDEPTLSIEYSKDTYDYEAQVGSDKLNGEVRAYTLTEAIKIVKQLVEEKKTDVDEVVSFEVYNPYTEKKINIGR